MPNTPSLLELLKAGVHFGHQKSRWHPKMEEYLYGTRNGVHVIDLEKTVEQLEKSAAYVRELVANGGAIMFVGTKRQARDLVKAAAEKCGMPFLTERWIGGMLTNFDEVKRRLKKYETLKQLVSSGEIEKYTKKEQAGITRQITKMNKYLSGITGLERMPNALYVADMRVEKTAITEAGRTNTTVVAVCDSNVNPRKVDFPIPGNDDAVNAIALLANFIADVVLEGKEEAAKRKSIVEEKKVVSATSKVEFKEMPTAEESARKTTVRKAPLARHVAKKEESL